MGLSTTREPRRTSHQERRELQDFSRTLILDFQRNTGSPIARLFPRQISVESDSSELQASGQSTGMDDDTDSTSTVSSIGPSISSVGIIASFGQKCSGKNASNVYDYTPELHTGYYQCTLRIGDV
ncbi:unnamed protein product [Phytophthora fragariaefolia]|uniref:Unnamed protein product n=1 Tax=Phytophthora fragariaefolia TaxID=1490495 RepID=A0A9W6XQF7_9STRA|nr:unnamed protein product [Phytophthora fragariaefolia]